MSDFFEFFVSFDLQSRLWWLKVVFLILGVYFIFGIIYFGHRSRYFQERSRRSRYWGEYKEEFSASQKHQQEWGKLEKYLNSDLMADHKRAVVGVGQLLEEVLVSAGSGQGDFEQKARRVIVRDDFDFERLLQAHKFWQSIIDDPQRVVGQEEAKKALGVYREALLELKYF